MAEQELQLVQLRQEFYRDGFYKAAVVLLTIACAVVLLLAISAFLLFSKPTPIQFATDDQWRVVPSVPVDKPYLSVPDLLQWTSEILPNLFNYDFVNYQTQMRDAAQNFTPSGEKKFLEVLNDYVNAETVANLKLLVNAKPLGAPFVLNKGLLEGKYAWWVQMPLELDFHSADKMSVQNVQVQALVIRVPTAQNLEGVSIDNMIVTRTG